jgi:hypothetical protein
MSVVEARHNNALKQTSLAWHYGLGLLVNAVLGGLDGGCNTGAIRLEEACGEEAEYHRRVPGWPERR